MHRTKNTPEAMEAARASTNDANTTGSPAGPLKMRMKAVQSSATSIRTHSFFRRQERLLLKARKPTTKSGSSGIELRILRALSKTVLWPDTINGILMDSRKEKLTLQTFQLFNMFCHVPVAFWHEHVCLGGFAATRGFALKDGMKKHDHHTKR